MSRILDIALRIEIINIYNETGNFCETARIFNQRHPDRQRPLNHTTVKRLYNKIFETGSLVDTYRRGKRKLETNVNAVENILVEIENDCHSSIRQISRRLHHSPNVVHRILKNNGYRPYKFQKHQRLLPVSYQDRLNFCNDFMNRSLQYPQFTSKILWSDECLFTLNGSPNKQNYR